MAVPATVRVNPTVPFPSRVTGSGPVTISKVNGVWIVSLTIAALNTQPPVQANLPTNLLLAYDNVAKTFFAVAESALVGIEAAYNSANNAASFVATGPQMAGAGVQVLELTGNLGAGANITTPTAAALLAAMPNAFAGQGYILRIKNSSAGAFAWTVVADASVTLTGTATIAQNTYRDFLITFTSTVAATMRNVGAGNA